MYIETVRDLLLTASKRLDDATAFLINPPKAADELRKILPEQLTKEKATEILGDMAPGYIDLHCHECGSDVAAVVTFEVLNDDTDDTKLSVCIDCLLSAVIKVTGAVLNRYEETRKAETETGTNPV